MPRVREGQKEFSAVVPEDEYRRFVRHTQINGATTWFIRNALREFNNAMDADPSLVSSVQRAIAKMVEDAKLARFET